MVRLKLQQERKLVGIAMVALVLIGILWWVSPGLPVLIGPWAWNGQAERGYQLFTHEWRYHDELAGGDGLGPVYNAKSCVACHFQGGTGGAGGSRGDIHAYHTLPTKDRPQSVRGFIHFASISQSWQESLQQTRQYFPVIKGSTTRRNIGGCVYVETIPDFDPLVVENLNATSLFGAGWIDLIPVKAIIHQHRTQTFSGTLAELEEMKFMPRPMGRARVLADGRIGKFGWKAQFATLEEFVAAACANEIGLSTPTMKEPPPLSTPDYVSAGADLSWRQFKDLAAFVATLPKPVEAIPDNPSQAELASRGKRLFTTVGCATCHVPEMAGIKGVYSDFLLHDIDTNLSGNGNGPPGSYGPPNPQELPPTDSREPLASEWKTSPLWGVADSAPYFHDGKSPTLRTAIIRHRGDATAVTAAYYKLSREDQEAVIAFLQTLRAPADATPGPESSTPSLLAKQPR